MVKAEVGTDIVGAASEGLTQKQRIELLQAIEKMKHQRRTEQDSGSAETEKTMDKVQAWASLGPAIGKAMADTARELGVIANDFVKTPVGQMTAVILFYKLVGKDVVGIFSGVLLLLIFAPIWVYLFRRMILIQSIEYRNKPTGNLRLFRDKIITMRERGGTGPLL